MAPCGESSPRAYTQNGQYSEAKAALDKIPQKLHQNPSIKAREGLYYVSSGDYEKAEEIYREIVDSSHPVPVAISGALGLALGDTEGAIDLMESVVEKSAYSLPWLRAPLYRQNDMLEEHPRYLALFKRIGLDDEPVAMLQAELGL